MGSLPSFRYSNSCIYIVQAVCGRFCIFRIVVSVICHISRTKKDEKKQASFPFVGWICHISRTKKYLKKKQASFPFVGWYMINQHREKKNHSQTWTKQWAGHSQSASLGASSRPTSYELHKACVDIDRVGEQHLKHSNTSRAPFMYSSCNPCATLWAVGLSRSPPPFQVEYNIKSERGNSGIRNCASKVGTEP